MGYERQDKYNNDFYNSSALAYAYPQEQEEFVEEKKRVVKPKEDPREKRAVAVHGFKLAVAICVVFVGGALSMTSYARIVEQRTVNTSLKNELISIQSENTALEAELAEKVDLVYIEDRATTVLGMSKPQQYQIVYVDVPKKSYTVQYDVAQEEVKEEFSLNSIIGLFRK